MNSGPLRSNGGTGRKRTVERAIIDTSIGLFRRCTPVCSWSRKGQPLSRCMKGGRGFSQSRRCYWALPRAVYAEDYQFNDSEFFRKAPMLPQASVPPNAPRCDKRARCAGYLDYTQSGGVHTQCHAVFPALAGGRQPAGNHSPVRHSVLPCYYHAVGERLLLAVVYDQTICSRRKRGRVYCRRVPTGAHSVPRNGIVYAIN